MSDLTQIYYDFLEAERDAHKEIVSSVDFKILDQNFHMLIKSGNLTKNKIISNWTTFSKYKPFFFHKAGVEFCGTLSYGVFNNKSTLSFRLPNGDFYYTPASDFITRKENLERHGCNGWVQLDSYYLTAFPHIKKMIDKILGKEKYRSRVYYNSERKRLDIKAYGPTYQVVITFEPGLPQAILDSLRGKNKYF